jgi:hypothetical protein
LLDRKDTSDFSEESIMKACLLVRFQRHLYSVTCLALAVSSHFVGDVLAQDTPILPTRDEIETNALRLNHAARIELSQAEKARAVRSSDAAQTSSEIFQATKTGTLTQAALTQAANGPVGCGS